MDYGQGGATNDTDQKRIRGIISALTAMTLTVGSLTASYDENTVFTPAGASSADLAVGKLVEVHVGASNYAARIEIEDQEDVEFDPAEGGELEVEGFIDGFSAHPGSFTVNNEPVQTTASTRFEGGVPADLADGVRVEAEGNMAGGVLMADKITFKETIRIEANADADGSAGVLGRTVQVTSLTEWGGGLTAVGDILQGNGLKIRGFLNLDGTTITATRVEKLSNPVDADKNILQGPVSSFDPAPTMHTMLIAGITVDAHGATEIRNDADQLITLDQFFASLTAGRTIVKARGAYSAGTLTVDKIEIE